MKLISTIAALLLASSAGYASAQSMKPGLWEITTQMKAGSGEMADAVAKLQKQFETMPPEKRKIMQDMLAKSGMPVGMGGSGMAIRQCVTQEMADRNQMATHQSSSGQGDCTQTNSPRVGNTMHFSFVCNKPPSSGEGQFTFTSSEAYSMKMTSTHTAKGHPEKMDMQNDSRWLSSDCGNIKPVEIPKE
jgi:hypothetical protein